MSGHNKWSKIKRKKAAGDAEKSRQFSKISRLITAESKKCGGLITSPSLATAIETAKAANMPKDTVERAIKKGTDTNVAAMESVTYEAYGPGGVAIVIEGLTDNRNRAAQEVRHALAKSGLEMAGQGAASWAFKKGAGGWEPTVTVPINETASAALEALIESLESLDDVQDVFVNAE